MGYFFEFDKKNKVARCAWDGRVTDAMFSEGAAAGRRFLASHPGVRGINDFSAVTELDAAIATVMSAGLGARGAVKAVVVVVAPTDLVFNLARAFSILGQNLHPEHHVVRTIEEAYKLLSVTNPQFVRVEP